MADNNVFILFEEIKTTLKGINGELEASKSNEQAAANRGRQAGFIHG